MNKPICGAGIASVSTPDPCNKRGETDPGSTPSTACAESQSSQNPYQAQHALRARAARLPSLPAVTFGATTAETNAVQSQKYTSAKNCLTKWRLPPVAHKHRCPQRTNQRNREINQNCSLVFPEH